MIKYIILSFACKQVWAYEERVHEIKSMFLFTIIYYPLARCPVEISNLIKKSEMTKQELSYRKQIARQLRTQYAEGIYDNPVTLKSRLTVTQGHWKRNRWVDHIRLTFMRVIGRWILSWPWNVSQRSFMVIEISAIRKLGCGFLYFYGRICSLWDIQCQRMVWPWKPG